MAAELLGAYSFVLTIGGVDTGFILFKDEGGNMAWYEGLAEKYAPAQRTQSFSYEYLPPDVDQPLAGEDWAGGAGYDRVRNADGVASTTKYSHSRGVNASYRHKAMLAHRIETALESDGTAIGDTPTDFYYSPTAGLFCLAGRYVYEFDNFTKEWTQRLDAGAGGTLRSMKEYNAGLVLSAGASADYYTSSDGSSWTAYTAEDENADFFETRSSVLWKVKGQAIKVSTTPTTTGWTGSDKFGHTSMTVESFLQADGTMCGFYREGIFVTDGTTLQDIWRAPAVASSNGKHATLGGDGFIYVPYGGYVMQFDPSLNSAVSAVFPLTEHLTNKEITGTPTAIAADERFLYVAIQNAEGNSYIMKGDVSTNEWHTWVYTGTAKVTAMTWVAAGVAHASNPCLMVGTNEPKAGFIILPRYGFTPDQDPNCRFETSGTMYGSNWDWGALAFSKFLNEGNVEADGASASNTVVLKYELDDSRTYTTLVTATDKGHSSASVLSEVSFNHARPVLSLNSGSAYSTPVCGGFALHATPNPPRRRLWRLTVILANDLVLNDGQIDTKQDVRWVKDRLRAGVNARVTLLDRAGDTAYVLLRDMQGKGVKPVRLGGEERDVELVDLTLVEITRLTDNLEEAVYGRDSYGSGRVYA